ncbi:MAG: DUF3343 domain-containing protein [Anaerovoracaceae bacterium]|jgi:hypothetical protein
MNYLATFHTHFDAVKYLKYIKGITINAVMKPVPRKLSSSCGSCVMFSTDENLSLSKLHTTDLDKLYIVNDQDFELIAENK